MKNYSIVLNGLFNKSNLSNVSKASWYSDDVIVSTWHGAIDAESAIELEKMGVKVVLQEDPGSPLITYTQDCIGKRFTAKRQFNSARSGVRRSIHDCVIRSRLDATMNYDKVFQIWQRSGRRFGSVNLTSVCPNRLGAYPYLYHISDWCHIGRRFDLLNGYGNDDLDEHNFCRPEALLIRDMLWDSRLSVEQILSLILTKSELTYDVENKQNISQYTIAEWDEHKRVLENFVNINQKEVNFVSDKYQFRSARWMSWDDEDFRDNGKIKYRVVELAMFLAGRTLRRIKK